ncbi:MAG: hypothetical protein HYT76_08555 [Deltaproteobacteria bacterium]|nr:hypothetical protein [Deltaproteobacteria bacterium]
MAAPGPIAATSARVTPDIQLGGGEEPQAIGRSETHDLQGEAAQLRGLTQKSGITEADQKKYIRDLSQKLEEAALSGEESAFQKVKTLLRGKDPKVIAQALHQIPTDAVVAQILVALQNNPSLYASTLVFLDFFSNPTDKNLLRDRALSLIAAIQVPQCSYDAEAQVRFSVLSLVARNGWNNNYQNLPLTTGPYEEEGVDIVAIMTGKEFDSGFMIVAKPGERITSEHVDHPGRQHEAYGASVNTSELFSNLRRVEHTDSRGQLIVRNYYTEDDGSLGESYEFRIFDSKGQLVEEGESIRDPSDPLHKSHSTRYLYDHEGHLRRKEEYIKGKLSLFLEYNEAGEAVNAQIVNSRSPSHR